ncbi:MAG: hypothetical protein AAGB15_04870 [Pseudomonadota bacterium]
MQAFRPCLLALMAALLPLMAGAETPEEAKARIENQTMNNTRPSDGYRYLSGNLPNFHNHPAIYAFQRGGKRMLMVVGRGVSDVYPMSQADTAFRAYQDLLRQVGYIQ